jgi:hypothetical protein
MFNQQEVVVEEKEDGGEVQIIYPAYNETE